MSMNITFKTILPILVSVMMFFSGCGFWNGEDAYSGRYEITMDDETLIGNAYITDDSAMFSLEGVVDGEDGSLSLVLDPDALKVTVNGSETVIPMPRGKLSYGSILNAIGIDRAEADYFLGKGLMEDIASLARVLSTFDIRSAIDIKTDEDNMGGTINVKGDSLKREMRMFLISLTTDNAAMSELTSLNAWDSFAPDVTNRRSQAIRILNNLADIISKLDITMDATLKARFDDDTSIELESDIRVGGVDVVSTTKLFMSGTHVDYEAKVDVVTGESSFTPYQMKAALELKDHVTLEKGDVHVSLDVGERHELDISYIDDQNAHNITADYTRSKDGVKRSGMNGNMSIDKAGIGGKLRVVFDDNVNQGSIASSIIVTGRLTEKGMMLMVDDNMRDTTSISIDWGEADKINVNLVGIIGDDISTASLDIEGKMLDDGVQITTTLDAKQNERSIYNAVVNSKLVELSGGRTIHQTLDVSTRSDNLPSTELTAKAIHKKVDKAALVTPAPTPEPTPIQTPEPTPLPTNEIDYDPVPTQSLEELIRQILENQEPTPAPEPTKAAVREYTATGSATGFSGKVHATVVCDANGVITSVTFKTEGEGGGNALDGDSAFAAQFAGMSGSVSTDSVDAITNATWTSYGAIEAVNDALKQIEGMMGE